MQWLPGNVFSTQVFLLRAAAGTEQKGGGQPPFKPGVVVPALAILEDRSVALPCSLPGKGVKFEVCESEFLERQVDERHGAGRMRGVERDPQDHFLSRRGADDRGKVRVPCSGTPSPVPGVQAPTPVRGHPRPAARVPEQPSGCLTLCLLF